ncbi:replicative DNA helicase [Salmonella enterica]|uniref:Replicative DNA helicase n=1 Tax=Salmonella enterica I TaxID=59201 RepID=A0A7Z1QBB1_SALET|nr:replicative DNA helicase [Salmonella enterica]EDJ8881141.1 replicative DNA helicase [Salmonella enterica subsp. diarizonae]EEJ4266182.1 replicative DNA helicase [Salmonella enterica subsp. diarizonae serovar 50:r:z]EAW3101931.1 replicative DNA helicase [Salmonella enterica]EAW4433683.1 replicative DNA helicase [Salmonella enterica]EBL0003695.1 replicative DNA helicase [Salmonella enterica]
MIKRKRQQPPHSVEAEQSVLGGLMLDNDRWDDVATQISAQDFFISAHRTIYSHMQTLIEQGSPIDLITLSESLEQQERLEQVGGFAYLAELSKNTPSAANIIPYAQYIASYGELRQLLLLGNELSDMAGQPRSDVADVLAFAEQKLFAIAQSHQDGGLTDINACFDNVLAGIAQRYEAERGSLSGTPSGLEQLDALTCGFQPADLIIAAARPSVGKTAFALTLCVNALIRLPTQPVQIYSMEMSAEQLLLRLVSLLGRVSQTRLRSGDLSDDDWQQIGISANILMAEWKDRLLIDDSGIITPSILRSRARRSLRQYGLPSLIVIDYLQLMRSGGAENRNQEISTISRSLKALAKELSCPVLALSQLNRALESRLNKRPCNADLRDSGSIEQDADVILFLYRDELYDPNTLDRGIAEVIVSKQRNGPIGTVRTQFISDQTRFESLALRGGAS